MHVITYKCPITDMPPNYFKTMPLISISILWYLSCSQSQIGGKTFHGPVRVTAQCTPDRVCNSVVSCRFSLPFSDDFFGCHVFFKKCTTSVLCLHFDSPTCHNSMFNFAYATCSHILCQRSSCIRREKVASIYQPDTTEVTRNQLCNSQAANWTSTYRGKRGSNSFYPNNSL